MGSAGSYLSAALPRYGRSSVQGGLGGDNEYAHREIVESVRQFGYNYGLAARYHLYDSIRTERLWFEQLLCFYFFWNGIAGR